MLQKNILLVGVTFLVACATAEPFQVNGGQQNNALIEGDSGAFSWLPVNHNLVFIEAVDGKKMGASESQVLLPPGEYTFSLKCDINLAMWGIQENYGFQNVKFKVEAGHIYKFTAGLANNTVPGDSYSGKMDNSEKFNSCKSFAYDATGGVGPYPETVHVVPPDNDLKWVGSGNANGGHSIQDWLPKDQSANNWNQMIEIEYWSNLMFPGSIDQFFHLLIESAKKQCPGTQMSLISENADDVYFELENSNCASSKVRTQISRFMAGKYGVYEVSYLSSNPVTGSDKDAWLQALRNAATVTQH
ncbi:MAG: hypothetical protein WBR29_10340 [Gammaproteobacteria bacterium]